MKKWPVLGVAVVCCGILAAASAAEAASANRIGVSATYWRTLEDVADDIKAEDIDEKGISYLVSYQYVPTMLLRLEGALEVFPTDFTGGDSPIWAPQGFIMAGIGPVYGGVGIGVYYADGNFAAAPFYVARIGLEFELLPQIFLAVDANYRVDDWGEIRELKEDTSVDTDSIRLGAAVHLGF